MNRTITRAAALIAAVGVCLAGTVAVATAASADEAVNDSSPTTAILHVAPTPVDPQPVVAGHDGDTLMQVNVAMPAKVTKVVTAVKGKRHSR
jgi:Ser/Thr protein kinase RdoA (MazF antagonist)